MQTDEVMYLARYQLPDAICTFHCVLHDTSYNSERTWCSGSGRRVENPEGKVMSYITSLGIIPLALEYLERNVTSPASTANGEANRNFFDPADYPDGSTSNPL